jgi:Rrf2 family iron-sulfur cluster assembly transcriptional regulator
MLPPVEEARDVLQPKVFYAAKALAEVVGSPDGALSVRAMAKATGVPEPYLAKIVHALARRDLVATRRGVGGGVTGARRTPLDKVTLYDLCIALDDPVVEPRCLIGEAECSDERACPAHAFWSPQRARLIEFLRSTTLRDVAAFERRAPRRRKARR